MAFERGFRDLLGEPISNADMTAFVAFLESIELPGNPHQNLDRTFKDTPRSANALDGHRFFTQTTVNTPLGNISCATCHSLPTGSNGRLISSFVLMSPQQMKVPHLRNLYRKVGADFGASNSKLGFGFTHDGAVSTLDDFIDLVNFNSWPNTQKDDIVAFLREFDTGTAPAVGHQLTVTQTNASSGQANQTLMLLESQAQAGNIDLVAKGTLAGNPIGFRYRATHSDWVRDIAGAAPLTRQELLQRASSGTLLITITGVPPGSGVRIGIDRDEDGTLDGEDGQVRYGMSTPGCSGDLSLFANLEPQVAEDRFALIAMGAEPHAIGTLLTSGGTASQSLLGVTIHVDALDPYFFTLPLFADAQGQATLPLPLPANPALRGLTLHSQSLLLDSCGAQGFAATNGLTFTIQ